jgi:TolB-like protein/predicted Zn-dependent protease
MTMVRQLTAIMFTDMVGYTALMQEDERKATADRDRQRAVLQRSIQSKGGRILQFYGDGTLSVFQSAVAAVEAAVAIQEALREGDAPIPLRIGIHTGDVVHDDNGVFGDGVNVASRIEGLGVPGSVLISGKVYDEVKNQPEISTRALGSFDLKNVKHPMRVYAVSNPGLTIPPEAAVREDREARKKSIAVLPFVNMSSDPENEFFSDGITEEIINALTRVNGLQVTARTSSFAFKNHNRDIREIAEKLGVTHILEGSVRKAGSRVRVTAQLICATDGYHLMSEVYDGSLEDIFALQDEIALQIKEHLAARLGPVPMRDEASGADRLVHGHSHDTAAYAEYLRGRHAFARWTPDDARRAIVHFKRSIELDPECSLPYTGLAKSYVFLGATGNLPQSEAYPEAEAAASRAVSLEESAGEAHSAMGLVHLFQHRDWPSAYRSFQKAITLTPGSAEAHQLYSMYLKTLGDTETALAEAEAALQLDPLSSPVRLSHAEALAAVGELDVAEQRLTELIEEDPDFRAAVEALGWVRILGGDLEMAIEHFERLPDLAGFQFAGASVRGYAYGKIGRTDDAHRMLALLEERARVQEDVNLSMDFALVYEGLGDMDAVFEHLEAAADSGAGGVTFVAASPYWRDAQARSDPRFEQLLRRIGYPLDSAA